MFSLSQVLLAGSKAAASKAGASVKKAASAKAKKVTRKVGSRKVRQVPEFKNQSSPTIDKMKVAPKGYRLRKAGKRRGISPYAVFVRKYANAPEFRSLSVASGARGRALGKKWRALPLSEKLQLVNQAKNTVVSVRARLTKRTKRAGALKKNKYLQFVKANYKTVRSLPQKQRLAALAKKWRATQKK